MSKKEDILLDATLGEELRYPTFRARLANGHEFVAFARGAVHEKTKLEPGMRVRVSLSPFDMGKGRILQTIVDEKTS